MAALAKLIDADRRRRSCRVRRCALLCAPTQCLRVSANAAQRALECMPPEPPSCVARVRSNAGFAVCIFPVRVHRLHHGCADAHPGWRHLCSPSPQVVDEALWIHHSRRRVREAPRPLCVEGTQGQHHHNDGGIAPPVSLESGVWQGTDAGQLLSCDRMRVCSVIEIERVTCACMLIGLDAPWDRARRSASARSCDYYLLLCHVGRECSYILKVLSGHMQTRR